jgi:hypothetical protein
MPARAGIVYLREGVIYSAIDKVYCVLCRWGRI